MTTGKRAEKRGFVWLALYLSCHEDGPKFVTVRTKRGFVNLIMSLLFSLLASDSMNT